MQEKQRTIGFIGVGVMGNPIAKHLIAKGHKIVAYDRSEAAMADIVAAGAEGAASAQAVVDIAPVVFTSLPSPAVFSQVMLGEGGIAGGKAVKIVVDLSTVGSRATKAAAAGLRE